ncbi:MAG: hypothetical protein MK207_10400 [Saprospiraceae bacterium]|nr:hypothetical protein [Saprospiraceae bacterium]
MGRFLIILLTFSLAFSINAQSVIWDSDDTDVLYDGINNVLPLKFIDVDTKNIVLSVSYGSIKQNEKGNYLWTAKNVAPRKEKLSVNYKGKIIAEFEKMFKRLPNPIPVLLPHQLATPKTMTGIRGILEGVNIKIPIRVMGYNININDRGDSFILKNNGAALTNTNKAMLKKVSGKAEVVITHIKFKCPGDTAGRLVKNIKLQ